MFWKEKLTLLMGKIEQFLVGQLPLELLASVSFWSSSPLFSFLLLLVFYGSETNHSGCDLAVKVAKLTCSIMEHLYYNPLMLNK